MLSCTISSLSVMSTYNHIVECNPCLISLQELVEMEQQEEGTPLGKLVLELVALLLETEGEGVP